MRRPIEILETPRDAMQGMSRFITTSDKLELLHALLAANFDILDIGSFVNPRFITQFSDLDLVLNKLRVEGSNTRLFVLVANEKGAQKASIYPQIDFIGFPFSTSESFLRKKHTCRISRWLGTNPWDQRHLRGFK